MKMDPLGFDKDNYDSVDLINKIYRSEEARVNIEADLSSSLMKLQLYVQQINISLDETSKNVFDIMPQVLRDTQLLQHEAISLKNKMQTMKKKLENTKKLTSSIYALKKINKINSKTLTKTEYKEEANSKLIFFKDIDSIFQSGNEEIIETTLYSIKNSLSVMNHEVDFENKKLQLEELKNRLEEKTKTKFIQAISSKNLEKSKMYIDIFIKIDRLTQITKYYNDYQKLLLIQEWKKTIKFSEEKNVTFVLRSYYNKLISTMFDQVKWCKQVFPHFTITILFEFFTDLLHCLSPSIIESFNAALEQSSNSMRLLILIELVQISCHFTTNLKTLIDAEKPDQITDEKILALAHAIYSPYIPYISKYGMYETSYLSEQLQTIEFVFENPRDSINALSYNLNKIMDYVNEAKTRCKLFTKGCGYPSLLKTVNIFFNNYLEKFKAIIRQLNKQKTMHEDWNLFQMYLALMQITGHVFILVEEFEKKLVIEIIDEYKILQNPKKSIFEQYTTLFLIPNMQIQLQEFIINIQKEDKSLLQSTIKSIQCLCVDLHQSMNEVIFTPIFTHLLQIQKAFDRTINTTTESSLILNKPDYSFTPQEYITQAGQYLMTLPQNLEPYFLKDNQNLMKALKEADLQYRQESCASGFTNILLGIVAKEMCQMFQDQTWGICKLNNIGCKQLATDIDYLGNILEELGLTLSENLQQMSKLLRLSSANYYIGSFGYNARVVAAVRQMRNITSYG